MAFGSGRFKWRLEVGASTSKFQSTMYVFQPRRFKREVLRCFKVDVSKPAYQTWRFKVGVFMWALQSRRFQIGVSNWAFQSWRFKVGVSKSALLIRRFNVGVLNWYFKMDALHWAFRSGRFNVGASTCAFPRGVLT